MGLVKLTINLTPPLASESGELPASRNVVVRNGNGAVVRDEAIPLNQTTFTDVRNHGEYMQYSIRDTDDTGNSSESAVFAYTFNDTFPPAVPDAPTFASAGPA
jgi:hypothetical protein